MVEGASGGPAAPPFATYAVGGGGSGAQFDGGASDCGTIEGAFHEQQQQQPQRLSQATTARASELHSRRSYQPPHDDNDDGEGEGAFPFNSGGRASGRGGAAPPAPPSAHHAGLAAAAAAREPTGKVGGGGAGGGAAEFDPAIYAERRAANQALSEAGRLRARGAGAPFATGSGPEFDALRRRDYYHPKARRGGNGGDGDGNCDGAAAKVRIGRG